MEFSKNKIQAICKRYGIKNYTINLDKSIDVDGDVYLFNKRLTELPLKFRNVSGGFTCSYNNLRTLEGAPEYVGGNFYCHHNNLESFKGLPIARSFECHQNPIFEKLNLTGKNFKEYLKKLRRSEKLDELLIVKGK